MKNLKICILGGGGNVAEAMGVHLANLGYLAHFFRFPNHIPFQGVPQRPLRPLDRIQNINTESRPGLYEMTAKFPISLISKEEVNTMDILIFAFPSYMANYVAENLGRAFAGKILINLSDRFLGTYEILSILYKQYGTKSLPKLSIAFNGVPIIAQKWSRNSPTIVIHDYTGA